MEAVNQLKDDLREGRVDVEGLFDVIATLQRQLTAAQQRIEELEKQAGGPAASATTKVEKPFSMRAEDKRQQARDKVKKRKPSRNAPTRPTRQRRQDPAGRTHRAVFARRRARKGVFTSPSGGSRL